MARDYRKENEQRKARIAAGIVGGKPGRAENTPEELWSKVDKRQPDECWEWKGYVSESGYGRTQIKDKQYYAHRVIFNLANPGMIELSAPRSKQAPGFLMHTCDNRLCCNPAHLRVATIKQNNQDCQEKGRRNLPAGEDHFRAVFTNDEIAQALEFRKAGKTATEISLLLNKNRSSVKSLLYRNKENKEPRVVTTEDEIKQMFAMRSEGHTAKHIAETMHKNLSTVKSVFQRNTEVL